MKITLLGHASILVEVEGGGVCLMDPVFSDPFEEGAVVSCPQRIVHPERLLPIYILVISHRHPDHFDFPSLAKEPLKKKNPKSSSVVDPLAVARDLRILFENA